MLLFVTMATNSDGSPFLLDITAVVNIGAESFLVVNYCCCDAPLHNALRWARGMWLIVALGICFVTP